MKNTIISFLKGFLVASMLLASTMVLAAYTSPQMWQSDGVNAWFMDKAWEMGATGDRIAKGWFTAIDTTNITIGGVSTGDLDMDSNSIINVGLISGKASTSSVSIRGLQENAQRDIIFETVNAAGSGRFTRLAIGSNLDTAVATWANITHTGIVLSGGLDAGSQGITNAGALSGITTLDASGTLTLGTASSAAGIITLQNATNANTVTIQSGVTSGSYTMTLPLAVAGAGEVLTDSAGDGVLSWAAAGGMSLYDAVICAAGCDYTNIQAAIDAGKKTIFVRDGVYTLTADIVFASDETVLIGESWDAVIAAGANYKINMGTYDNSRIEGLKITSTHTTNGAIYGTANDNTIIKNNFLDVSYGIQLTGGENLITGNTITGSLGLYAINTNIFANYDGTVITGNRITNFGTSTNGSSVFVINTGNNTMIQNNTISIIGGVNASNTYVIRFGSFGSVIGNYISDINSAGGVRAITPNGGHSTVSNNIMERIGFEKGITTIVIDGSGASNTTIIGNVIENYGDIAYATTLYGISTSNYTTVIGNYINHAYPKSTGTLYGIYAMGVEVTITGNYIGEKNASASTWAAIYLDNNYQTAVGNDIWNHSSNSWGIGNGVVFGGTGGGEDKAQAYANTGTDITTERRFILMKNTDGDAMAEGDLVVLKAVAGGNEVAHTTNAGDDKVFGMAADSIANGSSGEIKILGKTTNLKVDGTTNIAIGDFICTFTTVGIGAKCGAGDMAIAIALEVYVTDDSLGVIDALIISPRKI